MNEEIKPGIYRHFKGNNYKVLYLAKNSETLEQVVVYQALYGDNGIWVRPASMWNETVELNGRKVKRFTFVGQEPVSFSKIKSFQVDHDKLKKGVYISRTDGDIVTYDVRFKVPNCGDYIPSAAMHTIEHLLATYLRNSEYGQSVIYVGPMGCRTGFYVLMKDNVGGNEVIGVLKRAMKFISDFEGKIPGSEKSECGNYLEHDLVKARENALDMYRVLENYTPEMLNYER